MAAANQEGDRLAPTFRASLKRPHARSCCRVHRHVPLQCWSGGTDHRTPHGSRARIDRAELPLWTGERSEAVPLTNSPQGVSHQLADHGRWMMDDDERPVRCSSPKCQEAATILHKLKAYCGTHALELLEAGEGFERRLDLISQSQCDDHRK